MSVIERWDVFICPECGTLYPDLSSMCECQVGSELVQPGRVTVVPEQQLRGAVEALANLRQVAINGGAMEAGGGYDVTVLLPILRAHGGAVAQ